MLVCLTVCVAQDEPLQPNQECLAVQDFPGQEEGVSVALNRLANNQELCAVEIIRVVVALAGKVWVHGNRYNQSNQYWFITWLGESPH